MSMAKEISGRCFIEVPQDLHRRVVLLAALEQQKIKDLVAGILEQHPGIQEVTRLQEMREATRAR